MSTVRLPEFQEFKGDNYGTPARRKYDFGSLHKNMRHINITLNKDGSAGIFVSCASHMLDTTSKALSDAGLLQKGGKRAEWEAIGRLGYKADNVDPECIFPVIQALEGTGSDRVQLINQAEAAFITQKEREIQAQSAAEAAPAEQEQSAVARLSGGVPAGARLR